MLGSCVWGASDWDQADCCDPSNPYYVGAADALLYCNYDPFSPQPAGQGSPFGGATVQPSPFGDQQSAPTTGPSLTGPSTSPSISPGLLNLHALSPSFFHAATAPDGSVGGIPSRALGLGGGGSPAPGESAVGSFVGSVGTTTMVVLAGGAALALWLILK